MLKRREKPIKTQKDMTTIHVTIKESLTVWQYEAIKEGLTFALGIEGYDNPEYDYTEHATLKP